LDLQGKQKMDVFVQLADLSSMHPRLLWEEIGMAAIAVLQDFGGEQTLFSLELAVRDVPGFDENVLNMTIETSGVSLADVARLRRTYEPSRLVELAGIAVAGLGLYHAGRHEILDVALRGSSADYIVDEANHLLEVAGRSRRSDLGAAWEDRWHRLSEDSPNGFYVCVVEFETPAGQLAFQE
jgi:hypothetical protein